LNIEENIAGMKKKKDHKEEPELELNQELVSEEEEITKDLDKGLDQTEHEKIIAEEQEKEDLPLEEQVASLVKSIEEIEAKAEEYLDGWQRSRAEFANYKKRILKENTDIHQIARGEVIKLYLDIADDLERALFERPSDGEEGSWEDGIELIFQKLRKRLEAEGIKPMNPLGEKFDPNIHEALMKEESEEYESGHIIEVMQEGYWIGDKVLRPAIVRVAV
jgi:molecular chaperone GrpE